MNARLIVSQPSDVDADIKNIVDIYSEAQRETLTGDLLGTLSSSELVRILSADNPSGPGLLRDVLRVCVALGKIDASLAWVVGVSNSAWSMRSCFHSLEDRIAAMERNKLLAMVLGRPGSLQRRDESGKFFLTGEWKYASGWPYSSFFFCLAAVEGSGGRDIRVIAVPAEQLELVENWQSTGLRGTQSVTVRAPGIEIPPGSMEDYTRILSGESRIRDKASVGEQHASYSGLFAGVLMNCLLGAMLGAAEAALEYVVSAADKHPVAGSTYASMADSGPIRAEIGRLRGSLDLYKRAAEYNADIIDKAARNPEMTLTTQDRVDCRARATLVMRGCVDIVQDLLWIFGSGGLDKGHPLERIWRDVNVGARHGGFSKFVPEEAAGIATIGRDPYLLTRMF